MFSILYQETFAVLLKVETSFLLRSATFLSIFFNHFFVDQTSNFIAIFLTCFREIENFRTLRPHMPDLRVSGKLQSTGILKKKMQRRNIEKAKINF